MQNLRWHIHRMFDFHEGQTRKANKSLPYGVHPLWCALTMLTEPLQDELKYKYALALIYHDVVEDTKGDLSCIPIKVRSLVKDLTFDNFDDEKANLFDKSNEILLLKLYDKVHNLLDGHWMSIEKYKDYVEHTRQIYRTVKNNYPNLNIIKLAYSILSRGYK